MSEKVKILELAIERVKRIKAVQLTPSPDGLTIIGGRNGQGKTSALDAIMWDLGGNKHKPSNAQNADSKEPPLVRVELSNGLVVERSGKNGALKVTDSKNMKAGQQLLDELIGQLAIDLPKFMAADNKKKAEILLQTLGIGDKLDEFDAKEKSLYDERTHVGRQADQKQKHAESLPKHEDAPESPVSVAELVEQQDLIFHRNNDNAKKRSHKRSLENLITDKAAEIAELEKQISVLREGIGNCESDLEAMPEIPEDQDTDALRQQIATAEETNQKVRDNQARKAALAEAVELQKQRDDLTAKIEAVRKDRLGLLDGAQMPLDGLSVEEGELIYNGQKWDCMSSSEQLRVAVAIVRQLKPECGFVILDKLEQMDLETLQDFGQWLTEEGLQVIATRVSTGDECSVIIEDGCIVS